MSDVKSPVKIQPLLQPISLLILPSPVATESGSSTQQTVLPYFITASSVPLNLPKHTPPIKPAKKYRDEPTQILRCKRRLEFKYNKAQSATTVRRNERERNRVRQINNTFSTLRNCLPSYLAGHKSKKSSKVDTLKGAIEYINQLQQLLDDHDAVTAALGPHSSLPSPLSPAGSTGMTGAVSPGSTISSSSDSAYESSLGLGDEDLLDFNNWFD